MKQIVVKYGVLSGAVSSALLAIGMVPLVRGESAVTSVVIGFGSMIASFFILYTAVRKLRDVQPGGALSFWRAVLAGLCISLIAATVYVACWLVIYYFFVPGFYESYTERTVKAMMERGEPVATVAAKRSEMEAFAPYYHKPYINALVTYSEILPVGVVFSFIVGLLVRRRRTGTAT